MVELEPFPFLWELRVGMIERLDKVLFIIMSLFDSIKDWTYTFIIGVCVVSYW